MSPAELPLIDAYTYCRAFGWSFAQYERTPLHVLTLFGLYLEAEAAVRQAQSAE